MLRNNKDKWLKDLNRSCMLEIYIVLALQWVQYILHVLFYRKFFNLPNRKTESMGFSL